MDVLSVEEWLLQEKGVTLNQETLVGLDKAVSKLYKHYRKTNPSKNDKCLDVYTEEDFPILSVAFTKFMA